MNKNINEKDKTQVFKSVVKNGEGPATRTRAKIIDKANGDTKLMYHTHTGADEGSAISHTITAEDKAKQAAAFQNQMRADDKVELKTNKPELKPMDDNATNVAPKTSNTTHAEPTNQTTPAPETSTPTDTGVENTTDAVAPDTGGTTPDGLGWWASNWKTVAIAGAAVAVAAAVAKLLGKTIKVKYQKCLRTLKRMQKDFTFEKKGLDMKYILPGVGSKIMDMVSRLWGKRKNDTTGAIGLVPFCDNYKKEIKNDFILAQQSYNKVLAGNKESATAQKAESFDVVYNSFAEAFAAGKLYEAETLNESLTGILTLSSLAVTAGKFVIGKIQNGKRAEGGEVAVQVTKQSTREICYAIINNFCSKYINMQAVADKLGIKSTEIADLDKSTFEKFSAILKQYANAKPTNYTAQYGRIKEMYDKMLKHYFDIGKGIIDNFSKYAKPEKSSEKDDNLILASKEKLMALWEQQYDSYTNNFSHIVMEIINCPDYINYINFIIEDVLPIFETGVAGDADYLLNVMPKAGEQYIIRQTLRTPNVKDGQKNLGNVVLCTVVSFDEKTKNIVIKRDALVRGSAINLNNDGTCTVKNPKDLDFSKFDDKEGITVPYNKWIAMDPIITNPIETAQQVVITNPEVLDDKIIENIKTIAVEGKDESAVNFITQNITQNIVINITNIENNNIVANVVAILSPDAVNINGDGTCDIKNDDTNNIVKIDKADTITIPYTAIWEALPEHVNDPIENDVDEQDSTKIENGMYLLNDMFKEGNGEKEYVVEVKSVENDTIKFVEVATVSEDNIKTNDGKTTIVGLTDENKKDLKTEEQTITVNDFKDSDPIAVELDENKEEPKEDSNNKFTKIYSKEYGEGEKKYPVVVCAMKTNDSEDKFNLILTKTVDGENISYTNYDVKTEFTAEEFEKIFTESEYSVMEEPVDQVFDMKNLKGVATLEKVEDIKQKIADYIKSKNVAPAQNGEQEGNNAYEDLIKIIPEAAKRFNALANNQDLNNPTKFTPYKELGYSGLTSTTRKISNSRGFGECVISKTPVNTDNGEKFYGFTFIPFLCVADDNDKNKMVPVTMPVEKNDRRNFAPRFYLSFEEFQKNNPRTVIGSLKELTKNNRVVIIDVNGADTNSLEQKMKAFVEASKKLFEPVEKKESLDIKYSNINANESLISFTRTISGILPENTSRFYILSERFWGNGNVNESTKNIKTSTESLLKAKTIDEFARYAKNKEVAKFEAFALNKTVNIHSYINNAMTNAAPLYESVIIVETDNTIDRNIKRIINTGIHKIVK